MVFASAVFLFLFFPITLIGYYMIPKKYKNLWLFVASFCFYAWGGVQYAGLILLSTIVNFVIGRLIGEKDKVEQSKRKTYLTIGIIYNLSILFYFKYFNFFIENLEGVFELLNKEFHIKNPKIILPIGISFFTFQIISYIVDVYREEVKPQDSLLKLGLYIMLFPQLIAGPIVRYVDVEKEIDKRHTNILDIRAGLERFIIGLGKKVLIANILGSMADAAFRYPNQLSMPMAWLGIICYSLQLYYDFSAYSDMAIGLGKLFGFNFMENFNYPYKSTSIREFWRRWHISLSSWFKDYLYIALGGNRKGKAKTYRNLFIVFFVTGLWHGAAWNFIIWGLFHGLFSILERRGFGKRLEKLPRYIQHIYTMIVVMIGWVFFRADDIGEAFSYIKCMFSFDFEKWTRIFLYITPQNVLVLLVAITFSTGLYPYIRNKARQYVSQKEGLYLPLRLGGDIYLLFILLVSILFIVGSSFNPFIYFRF